MPRHLREARSGDRSRFPRGGRRAAPAPNANRSERGARATAQPSRTHRDAETHVNFDIALLLAQDGVTNGAIYALLALALVLVFAVTRVIFIPQGEFVAYGALTLVAVQSGKLPGTVWLLLVAGGLVLADRDRQGDPRAADPGTGQRARLEPRVPAGDVGAARERASRSRCRWRCRSCWRWRWSCRSARCSTGSPTSRWPKRRC